MISRKDFLVTTLLILGIIDAGLYATGPLLLNGKSYRPQPRTGIALDASSMEPLQPLPLTVDVNQPAATLGKKLFHDPRLSADGNTSCANCHNPASAGMDGKRTPSGTDGYRGKLNTPTVFNSGFNTHQFWDGRAATLEEQLTKRFPTQHEMVANWPEATARLKKDGDYVRAFAQVFDDGLTGDNIAHAIAEFERTLITPNARFDRFLRGEASAISSEEKQGYRLFKAYGCATCHQGAAVGGNMFERLGTVRKYFDERRPTGAENEGRFNVTRDEHHHHYFKVPSLRNVEKTAPYFHNGSVSTLDQAVREMSYYNLGVQMPDSDVALIVKFLKTLTGEYEGHPL